MKSKSSKLAIGSAICFFLYPIIASVWVFIEFGEIPILFMVWYFALAIMLLLQKNSIALVIIMSVRTLLDVFSCIESGSVMEYLSLFGPIFTVILLLVNKVPSWKSKANQFNKLWFAPFAILFVCSVIPVLISKRFDIRNTFIWAECCLAVGYLLLGLWLKRSTILEPKNFVEQDEKEISKDDCCNYQLTENDEIDTAESDEIEITEGNATEIPETQMEVPITMNEEFVSYMECHDGTTITLYSDVIVIDRSNSSQVTFGRGIEVNPQGKGTKSIPLRMIQSVEFQEAEEVLLGTKLGVLEFSMPGRDNGFTTTAVQARMFNLNRFQFLVQYNDAARAIKDYVEDYIIKQPSQSTTVIQQLSAADEIKKFKELLDMGIITQEEFDAKKKQLLGL